jgi:hypothetical protein
MTYSLSTEAKLIGQRPPGSSGPLPTRSAISSSRGISPPAATWFCSQHAIAALTGWATPARSSKVQAVPKSDVRSRGSMPALLKASDQRESTSLS